MIYVITTQLFETEITGFKHSTPEEALEYLQQDSIKEIELDTEATSGNRLAMIQFGANDREYVIDGMTIDIQRFKPLLEDESKLFILQNAQYDLPLFLEVGIDIKNVYDTFLAECVLTTGLSGDSRDLSLKGMAMKYLNINLDKTERGRINYKGFCTDTVIYAAEDVVHMRHIKARQLEEIEKWDLNNILNLENKFVRVLAKMITRGMNLDPDKWMEINKIAKRNTSELSIKMDKIIHTLGTANLPESNKLTKYVNLYKQGNIFFEEDVRLSTVNWSSPSQKLSILKDLGISITSVGEDELIKVSAKHEIVPLMIKYSKSNKLVTSFGSEYLKYINPITKKIHPSYWQILSTGRISMSSPKLNWVLYR